MRAYLREFLRILDECGKVFFTTFVEEDVPNISINPENSYLEVFWPPSYCAIQQRLFIFSP